MTRPQASRPRWQAELALGVIALIWGATFVVVQQALGSASTLLFLALRFSLAAVALGIAFRRHFGSMFRQPGALAGGALAGLCLFTGYLFQTVGLRYTTASKSAFITGLSIVLVPLLGSLVYRMRPEFPEIAGVLTAVVGLGLLTLDESGVSISRGDLLTLACAFSFALHILVLGRYSRQAGFEALSFLQIATCAAIAVGTFWWAEPPRVEWRGSLVAALLVTGLAATALAFTVQTWAQRHTTATRTALLFALEPVFAAVTSFLVMGEILPPRGVLGAALILAGILVVELKPFRRVPHPSG